MRNGWALTWFLLAVACGAALFHTSQRANDGRARLAELSRRMAEEKDSVRVLDAEWSYLNQPARLEKLARGRLGLEPMKGRQFVAEPPGEIENTEKPAAIEPAAGAEKPAPKPVPAKPARAKPSPAAAASPPSPVVRPREFGDVMKSLGER